MRIELLNEAHGCARRRDDAVVGQHLDRVAAIPLDAGVPRFDRLASAALEAAAAATDSTLSPPRIRAWMSRGRTWLSIWISNCPRRARSPRIAACSRSSTGRAIGASSPSGRRMRRVPSSLTATSRSSRIPEPPVHDCAHRDPRQPVDQAAMPGEAGIIRRNVSRRGHGGDSRCPSAGQDRRGS